MVDDFLAQSFAEIVEIVRRAVVGERQDRNRVAADERRGDGPLDQHGRLAPLEGRRISAFGQLDDPFVRATLFAIIANQLRPQPPRLDAHDRIRARIERLLLAENLHADDVLFQLAAAAGNRFVDDERQEPLEPIHLLERCACDDALQLVANGSIGVALLHRGVGVGHGPYVSARRATAGLRRTWLRGQAFGFRLSTFGFRLSAFGFRLSAFDAPCSPRTVGAWIGREPEPNAQSPRPCRLSPRPATARVDSAFRGLPR